jgi:predicted dehydrogenase
MESGYWRPVGLVDVVPEYLAAAREVTGLPESACFTSIEAALEAVDSDAVAIASPVVYHAPQILASLRAGRHVLTEKCFTTSIEDAEDCVAEAAQRHRKLLVVQNARLAAVPRTLRRLIAEEKYGPLGLFLMSFFKPRGNPYNRTPHMHLWQQGVHELDTMLGVVQRPVVRVWGLSNNPAWCDWPSESTVQAMLECQDRVSGTYVSTSNARGDGFEFRLECAEAALVAPRSGGTIQVLWGPRNRHAEEIAVDPPDTRGLEHHPAVQRVLAGEPSERGAGSLVDLQIYRNFYEYIMEGDEPESSGRRNLETIRLLDAIVRSTAERRAVDV